MTAILMNTPWPYRIVTIVGYVLMIFSIFFIYFGKFREHHVIPGRVYASERVVSIRLSHRGWVESLYVKEGQKVQRGDALFQLNSADQLYRLKGKQNRLEAHFDRRILAFKIKIKEKIKEMHVLSPLLEKGYIASAFFQQKRDELFRLKEGKKTLEAERMRYRQSCMVMVRAPKDGLIGSLNIVKGTRVIGNEELLSIVPIDAEYLAELNIPIEKIGYIHLFDDVILRYDAYPYQKFGVGQGHIQWIDQVLYENKYYKAKVLLDVKENADQQKRPLLNGMTFSGIVLGSPKPIWHWVKDRLS